LIRTLYLYMILFPTIKVSYISRIIDLFIIVPLEWLTLLFALFLKNLLNFRVSNVNVSVSLQLLEHSSPLSSFWTADLSIMLFYFLSPCSCSLSLIISSSYSLRLPNSVAVVKVVKSFVSEMVVTFGCQLLSRHFRILIFNSSLLNILPRQSSD